jgi:hypothetical protein
MNTKFDAATEEEYEEFMQKADKVHEELLNLLNERDRNLAYPALLLTLVSVMLSMSEGNMEKLAMLFDEAAQGLKFLAAKEGIKFH